MVLYSTHIKCSIKHNIIVRLQKGLNLLLSDFIFSRIIINTTDIASVARCRCIISFVFELVTWIILRVAPQILTSYSIYDPEPFGLKWMLPTLKFFIAKFWPRHPSNLAIFVGVFCVPHQSHWLTYKYKDTLDIFFLPQWSRRAIKTSIFA